MLRPSMKYILWLALLALPTAAMCAEPVADPKRVTIDVFTTSTAPTTGIATAHEDVEGFSITLHRLDGIERFEAELADGLPPDPEHAKRQVLARMKKVSRIQRDALQGTAESLALALHYGVDRYPAIVFDARWVVYGVSNLQRAIRLYQDWQRSVAE